MPNSRFLIPVKSADIRRAWAPRLLSPSTSPATSPTMSNSSSPTPPALNYNHKITGIPCVAAASRYTAPVHIDVGGTIYTSSLETLTKPTVQQKETSEEKPESEKYSWNSLQGGDSHSLLGSKCWGRVGARAWEPRGPSREGPPRHTYKAISPGPCVVVVVAFFSRAHRLRIELRQRQTVSEG
ncbi:hypothetical protein RUM44_010068 [Polyplax serrata]|uniref:Potassium channel tetramerisation-type BTB domain-containing protein n=1 Tax=Polyplax serrata TaxID=468196 RepID=A0ABR1AUI9_POLSC